MYDPSYRPRPQPLCCKVSLWARNSDATDTTTTSQWELIDSTMLSTAIDGSQSVASSATVGRSSSAQLRARLKGETDNKRLTELSRIHGVVFLKSNEVFYQDTGSEFVGSTHGSEVVSPGSGERRKIRGAIVPWLEEEEVHLPGDFILTYKVGTCTGSC